MKTIPLGKSGLMVPAVAVGCMRMAAKTDKEAEAFIRTALELGANFFDHADIYGGGESEETFSRAVGMTPRLREGMLLQSKCGIRQGMYDFSKEHILSSVDGSLKRLRTDYLDVLLLHRPDALMEPEEVAEAFDILHTAGKVRYFGVSNQNPMQMQLLMKYCKQPLVADQLQLSAAYTPMIDAGLNVNVMNEAAVNRDGGVLDFCRLNEITIQPWSPFQYGFFGGVFLGSPDFPELNAKIGEIAAAHGVSGTTAALAWLLRHPAKMQPVVGTMNPARLRDCIKATEITLTREEWYAVYLAAGNTLP
ncbi:MAG TPA: aldo/keto reductase [Firmicutes bacterium]|nr:aldo/keto reductase [Bacillota bacterium]